MKTKQATIHCDYFKFSVPHDLNTDEIDRICKDLFGESFNRFEKGYGSRECYKEHYSFGGIIRIFRHGYMKNAGSTVFELTGTAMKFPQVNLKKLCDFVVLNSGNVCRLDITADDHAGTIPYDEMVELSRKENFKKRVKTRLCRNYRDDDGNIVEAYPSISTQPRGIKYGLPGSNNYIAVYAHEEVLRVELRMRQRDDTIAIAESIAAGEPVGELFAGILKRKLDFLQDQGKRKDQNASMPWWDEFLGGIKSHKIVRRKRPKSDKWQPDKLQRGYKIIADLSKKADETSLKHLLNYSQYQIEKLENSTGNTSPYFHEQLELF